MRKALPALLSIVAVLGLTEAGAAIIYRTVLPEAEQGAIERLIGEASSWQSARLRFRSHPYLGYALNPDYVSPDGTRQHSASGWFRGPDPARRGGALRVLALGGSTTYGVGVERHAEAWPALLEKELERRLGRDVEVLNAGVPNWTTFELLGVATLWMPELAPDIVILHIGFNDAFTTGYPDEGGPDNTRYRHAFTYRPPPGWLVSAMKMSHTARIFLRGYLAEGGLLGDDINAAMMEPRPRVDEQGAHIEQADGRWFRRNVQTLVALIRRQGGRPIFAPVPLDPVRAHDVRSGPYYLAAFRATERNARILNELGEELGVPVVDVSSGLGSGMFLDVAHIEERGMQVKARAMADGLVGAGLVEAPARPAPSADAAGEATR